MITITCKTPAVDIGHRESALPVDGFLFCRLLYSDIIHERNVFPYETTDDDTIMRPVAHQWWTWSDWPNNDAQQFRYLAATNRAATLLGKHYDFMPHPFAVDAPTFDYRFLLSNRTIYIFKSGRKAPVCDRHGRWPGFSGHA